MHKTKTLDPVLLGRPLPAFDALAALLSQHITQHMQQTGHRNVRLQLQDAHFAPLHGSAATSCDALQIHIPRPHVLQLMAARYGFTHEAEDATPAITRTEQRIAGALENAVQQALHSLLQTLPSAPPQASTQRWQWQALLRIQDHAPECLRLDLDSTSSAQLEHWANQRRPTPRQTPHTPEPLHIELRAVLIEKTVSAADIQQLHVGSVLPIALERARVTLNDQAMLTASVAEHHGKLHLTAFETLE